MHWDWFTEKCSTLKGDPRYTSKSVFDTFPWPQSPTRKTVKAVADAARALRRMRWALVSEEKLTLRELYRSLEELGDHPLRAAHSKLDECVRKTYRIRKSDDVLAALLHLNQELAVNEQNLKEVVGPGIPSCVETTSSLISDDSVS
jgi:hypothetical protein